MTMKEFLSIDWDGMSIHQKLRSVSGGIDGLYIPDQILQLLEEAASEIATLREDNQKLGQAAIQCKMALIENAELKSKNEKLKQQLKYITNSLYP